MPAIGPNTEQRRTPNGTGVRTAGGWVWLCDHCHRVAHLGVADDGAWDVDALLASLDATHWCEHKGE